MYICKGNKSDMAQPIFLDTCIHIYIYTHTKHVFCSLFFKGPLKRKGEQETRGYHHQRYWDWHVGSDAGEFIALPSLVLGLRDRCMAW